MFYQWCCIMEKSWGHCKNKTENQRQEASVQILRTPENSWLQGTLIDRSSSNASIPTLKPRTTQGQQVPEQDISCKFSSNTGTQSWASIYRLPKVTPNPLTSHNSLLDTSLHSREKKSSSTHQNTETSFPNQETLTSHPYKLDPQWGNSTIKRTPQTARIQKAHPKHRNINRMKRQRNTQQVKEQDKCPPNQTKEEELGNLPEKEFRIMIVNMIQNL